MPLESSKHIKSITQNGYVRLSAGASQVRSSFDPEIPKARGVDSLHNSKTSKSVRDCVFDILSILDDLKGCSSSKSKDKKHPPTTDPTSQPKNNNSTTHPTPKSQSKKAIVQVDADYCEALVDELMSIVDFGQAINEPTVEIAGERCLWLINEGVSGNER